MFRKKKNVNKKKLEHKLYLARETPEPIFDLSECDILQVPSGIYALCKVFRKEFLQLQNNQLTCLSGGGELKDLHNIKVLNISCNNFSSIPEEIYLLQSLQELYIGNNQIKKLPETMCHLTNLKALDLSNNLLKHLPENIGNMTNLRKLQIENNNNLKYLPKGLCKAQRLVSISLDVSNFSYPPSEVVRNGTEAIMKYICEDTGFLYVPPHEIQNTANVDSDIELVEETDSLQEKLMDLEKLKLKRMQEFLEIERNNELLQKQEIEMAAANKVYREKLLASITEQQNKFDDKLSKIHKAKECERFKFIEQLQEAENTADIAINTLLTLSKEPMIQLLEHEKEEEERLFTAVNKYNETLRRDDILLAMEDMLKQESEMFDQFDKNREENSKTLLEQELENDSRLARIIKDQDIYRSELLAKLLEDSDLQKAAVASLLERGDTRSWGLLQQVRLVESQLVTLTNIELDRKKLKMDEHLNDLSEKRVNLSILLIDLLDQQRERRAQLLSTLQSLEEKNAGNLEDFWLRQYQQLLDKLPEGLSHAQKNIDPTLAEQLLLNGVWHCIPFLAKLMQGYSTLNTITSDDLLNAGVANEADREKLLNILHFHSKQFVSVSVTPSAPPLEDDAPSAPPLDSIKAISSVQCVICMDLECHIIFVPCGHLCCCKNCAFLVMECPLCRSNIERKITMEAL